MPRATEAGLDVPQTIPGEATDNATVSIAIAGPVTSGCCEPREDLMKHRKAWRTKDRSACIGLGEPTQTREDVEHWRLRAKDTSNQSRPDKKIAADHDVPPRTGEVELETDKDSEMGLRQAALAEASDNCRSRSDQDRIRDALEDDEVREVLRMRRRGYPPI